MLPTGWVNPERERRVVDALGVDPTTTVELPPFEPADELPPEKKSRCRRGPYLRAAEVDAKLEPFVEDAHAGVPDSMLAQRSGLTTERVRQWRRRRGIQGRRGRPSAAEGRAYLVAPLLGERVPPVAQDVDSPVGGRWRPPVYLLREPLRYDLFTACVVVLVEQFTTAEISAAIGIAERDVFDAIALHEARGGAA